MLKANVNPLRQGAAMRYRDRLEPDVLAGLEEINSYDLALYAYAADLFEEQWSRYRAQPKRTYSIASHLRALQRSAISKGKRIIGHVTKTIHAVTGAL